MTTPADDTPRVLAELTARVLALESWRVHQTDLVDELLNGIPEPPEEPTDTDDPIDVDELVAWVHRTITCMIARPIRGELAWCPAWWEHPEAIFRFEALRRSWLELAPEPGAAMSTWIRDHLDPCLRELLSPLGTFADCASSERFRPHGHDPVSNLPTGYPYRTD